MDNIQLTGLIKSGANIALTINAADLKAVVSSIVREERAQVAKEIAEQNESATLTRRQAAKALNVTLSTLWRWDKEGYLKPVKIGTKVLYRQCDIDNILCNPSK